jgi:hypothetical protein
VRKLLTVTGAKTHAELRDLRVQFEFD